MIGAAIALAAKPGARLVGLLMAFAAGALISAVAYELVGEAFHLGSGSVTVAAGLAAGTLTFYAGDGAIARRGGGDRKRSEADHGADAHQAIVLGTILDGIPEGIVIGLSLVVGGEVSVAIIGAVFMSNLPEAVGATSGLVRSGFPAGRLLRIWTVIAVLTAGASGIGYQVGAGASDELLAFIQAFAGGALLTMLSSTLIPEAVRAGGREVGLLTVLGFAISFVLTEFA